MTCKNNGCGGRTRQGQHFCYDCYTAWQAGTLEERLEGLTVNKHECVGTAQLAEKDAEIAKLHKRVAEYAVFKHGVMESVRLTMTPCQGAAVQDAQAIELIREKLRGYRPPSTCKHPSAAAKPVRLNQSDRQLDRIESLIGLIEPSNYFWPCVWSAAAGALAVLAYIKW